MIFGCKAQLGCWAHSFILGAKPGCENKQKHSTLANLYETEGMRENYNLSEQGNAIAIQKMKYSFPSKC